MAKKVKNEYSIEDLQQYAKDVVNGKITAGKLIILSCKRYLSFFERDDIFFNLDKVNHVIRFIGKLKHFKGSSANKPFKLEPWQIFIVANIFGFYYKSNDKRVCTKCYIEVCRKNGKTALIAAIGLYMLIADGEASPEVCICANSRRQAKVMFEFISQFTKGLDVNEKLFKRFRDTVKFPLNNGTAEVFAADSKKLDGFSPSCAIIDELHAAHDGNIYNVLRSGNGNRSNPLMLCITSCGLNSYCFCHDLRNVCRDILTGLKSDDSQFSAIYELDEEDDYTDEKNFLKGNPNLSITVTKEGLKEAITEAKNNPATENETIVKRFGRWTNSSSTWIPSSNVIECMKPIDLEEFRGYTVTMGVDLSSVSDLTAISICAEIDGKYKFKSFAFLPEDCLQNNDNKYLYETWHRNGELILTPSNTVDYDIVLKKILEINEVCPITKILYDKYNSTSWALNCIAEGMPLEPFSQSLFNFSFPTKYLQMIILNKQAEIDRSDITNFCFENVLIKEDWNENIKPYKESKNNKIDIVISMIQALAGIVCEEHYNNEIFKVN